MVVNKHFLKNIRYYQANLVSLILIYYLIFKEEFYMNSVLNSGRTTICDAYNVAAHDPFNFQHKSLDTVQKEWTEWKKIIIVYT